MFISLLVLYSDIYVLIRMDCCGFVQFNHNTVVCHTVGAFYWDTIYCDLGVLGGLAGGNVKGQGLQGQRKCRRSVWVLP